MKRFANIIATIIALSSWGLLMGQEQNHSHENGKNEGMVFFTGTWDEALAQAKKENKLIFLDIYASWCAPCKMLKNNFGQAGLDYLNTMSKKVTETQPD